MRRVLVLRILSLVAVGAVCLGAAACRHLHRSAGPAAGTGPPPAPAGYTRVVDQTFTGSRIPPGWHPYSGHEGSDPAGWWDPSHVTVRGGNLVLRTYRDRVHYGLRSGTPWVEGGIDLWPRGVLTDGEYLVRSRVTSPRGVTQVELLWPDDGVWPPEIDFNESDGTNESTATLVYGTAPGTRFQQQLPAPEVDLTQWHTWGVRVTPSALFFLLDGRIWGTMPNREQVPVHLAVQQQVWPCHDAAGRACPRARTPAEVDLQVAWVGVYAPVGSAHGRR